MNVFPQDWLWRRWLDCQLMLHHGSDCVVVYGYTQYVRMIFQSLKLELTNFVRTDEFPIPAYNAIYESCQPISGQCLARMMHVCPQQHPTLFTGCLQDNASIRSLISGASLVSEWFSDSRGDRGELTQFSLKTMFCENGTSLLNYVGMLVFHAISHVS